MLHGTLSSDSKAPQFFPFGEEQIYPLMFCMMMMVVVMSMIIVNMVIVNTVNMMMIEMSHIPQMMFPFGSHV